MGRPKRRWLDRVIGRYQREKDRQLMKCMTVLHGSVYRLKHLFNIMVGIQED